MFDRDDHWSLVDRAQRVIEEQQDELTFLKSAEETLNAFDRMSFTLQSKHRNVAYTIRTSIFEQKHHFEE